MKKIFILIILLLLTGCSLKDLETYLPSQDQEYTTSIVAVGDDLIHQTIYKAAEVKDTYDFSPMFVDVKPYIKSFDLAFINQETILGGKELGLSAYPCFNSPQELGDALVEAGFNMVSMANNHTLDRGETAVLKAIDYWDKQPVIYSGAVKTKDESQIKVFSYNGIKFAFAAYTYGTNGILHPDGKEYLANVYSYETAAKDIAKIQNQVDVIIVSMHWGFEYESYPSKTQIKQAHELANLGVDIIIGHHPHVIQPVDLIDNDQGDKTFVIYSLGNFLSDQVGIDRLIGMAASVNIHKKVKNKQVEISLSNFQAKLLYRYKDVNNNTFNVKLFTELNSQYLQDYQVYFDAKKNLIQTYFNEIIVS